MHIGKSHYFLAVSLTCLLCACSLHVREQISVPFQLAHNRMLISAEFRKPDGTWRSAQLWVDSGNPDFFLSESLAKDLGINLSRAEEKT